MSALDDETPEQSESDDAINLNDLFLKGDDLQKLSVIHSLPQMLHVDNHATITRIIPKIQQELPNSSSELHLAASRMFRLLIEKNVPGNLIAPVLQGIDSKDPIVSNAWMETLLMVIPQLPEDIIRRDVLRFAIAKSQFTQSPYTRIGSCRMLGQISIHHKMTSFEVRKDVVPLVQSLYQDCFYEVRAAICRELPNVAQGLKQDVSGENIIKSSILPVLVELSNDESAVVRCSSVDSVAMILPFLPLDTIKSTIVPLVRNMCTQSVNSNDSIYVSLAKMYGKLITNLQSAMIPTDCEWFLDFYAKLSKRGLSMMPDDFDTDPALGMTCREFCAYNLPAVTLMVTSLIPNSIDKWYSIFKNLAGDSCYLVRKTVAGCIHELARILSIQNKILKSDFVKLLRDEAEEVLESLVPVIQDTLNMFSMSKVLCRETASANTLEIGRALLKCQSDVFKMTNWRLKMSFLEQLEKLPNCMPSDFIHQHFTPVVLNLTVDARAKPVRCQAARTVLLFLRYNIKENQRRWIRENLINQLCHSPCCYTRHIFIKMCIAALDVFSWRYFKEHFYLPLLSLAEDPVSTIRFCVVTLIPVLKQILVLPLDRQLQIKLENVVSKMEIVETDKDVINILKSKLRELRVPHVGKQQDLTEEKRRIEEEEKINAGRSVSLYTISVLQQNIEKKDATAPITTTMRSRSASRMKGTESPGASNNMSFLGKHFYIDAGIRLPENEPTVSNVQNIPKVKQSNQNLCAVPKERCVEIEKLLLDIVPTISVENTNIDILSERDLKELETTTSNITDDVKVSIQEISVKKRSKRYSCIFDSENRKTQTDLRRRSLNLTADSRIPICSNKTRHVMAKKKSEVAQKSNENLTVKASRILSRFVKNEMKKDEKSDVIPKIESDNGNKDSSSSIRDDNKNDKSEIVDSVPTKSKDIVTSVNKSSNLPVLVRASLRSQSEKRPNKK